MLKNYTKASNNYKPFKLHKNPKKLSFVKTNKTNRNSKKESEIY